MSEKAHPVGAHVETMSNSSPPLHDPEKPFQHEDAAVGAIFEVDEEALPPGYFRSKFFVGTMMGIGLGLCAGVAAFGYAAPILSLINADIGPVRNSFHSCSSNSSTNLRARIQTSSGLRSPTH